MDGFKIFVVDDDPWYADILKYHLSRNTFYEVETFSTGKECLANLYKKPTVITLDYGLPDMKGKDLLQRILGHDPDIAVIIISGQKDITTAVQLIKKGAFDYLVKDEDTNDHLGNSLRLLQETLRLKIENKKLKEEISRKYQPSDSIAGNSQGIRDAFKLIEKAAQSQITVSITGETGTGKELVAKAIHYHSERHRHPFVAVNFSGIPRELLESELFGHEKGSFTGAHARKTGLFEEADRGTIFLDEVAEMDLNLQTKLLRVLQEREIRRIGSNQNIKINVRVITATHKNLAHEVQAGNFRADLYYRLLGLQIHLQPLRERGNDILLLARHFADNFCRENKRKRAGFTEEAIKKLTSYHYPGNVRELKAVVELAIILSEDEMIHANHITFNPPDQIDDLFSADVDLDGYIARIISHYMQKSGRNIAAVAKQLGISRATIYRYLKSYNI